MKKDLKLYLSEKIKNYYLTTNETYYKMQSHEQFLDYFLPKKYSYTVIDNFDDADIYIWNMELEDNSILNKNKINILISIENINFWGKIKGHWDWSGYKHYKKYNDYDNNNINIYYYNHIYKINKNENYISVPMIYIYMNYYLMNSYKNIPSIYTSFSNKKFCLLINKSGLNNEINSIENKLSSIDIIDNIKLYNNEISNKSCYNSNELLNIFNKYKFIICFENSYDNGYITEKIFNCFFARTIPIYKGSPIINNYINRESFIDANNLDIEYIKLLNSNENLYNEIIECEKISNNYDNENYHDELINIIEKKLLF